MTLETERLILRPWNENDAEECFRYARDPRVGPIAGWPPHHSVEESRRVLREVLMVKGTFAIVLKETGLPVGSISIKQGPATDLTDEENECELGYWLGVPWWGKGIMSEAVREVSRYAFETLGMNKLWCGYYDGNARSRRVQEKCGFRYQWTTEGLEVPLMGEIRTGHVTCLTREEWEKRGAPPYGS